MRLNEIVQYLEELAPLNYQESYDNCGLLIGDKNSVISSAVVCLDCTEEVIDEAMACGANLVIAHHPLIFSGLKKITGETYIERAVAKAIKNDVAVYAIHTNLDNVKHGVNAKICELLQLKNTQVLAPKRGVTDVGSGMVGELVEEIDTLSFLNQIKTTSQKSPAVQLVTIFLLRLYHPLIHQS